jgi:hypothetical protein
MDQFWGFERVPLEVCRRLMVSDRKTGQYASGIC